METKTTFNASNFNDGKTPKWVEVIRYFLKIATVSVPFIGSIYGLKTEVMTALGAILMAATEGLKMFSVK